MKSVAYKSSRGPVSTQLTLVFAVAVLLLLLSGCKTVQNPIPVYGTSEDTSQLLGEWFGEYTSQEANRHGVIYFKLDVDSDSAFGEVIMKQGQWEHDYAENIGSPDHRPSEMLTIRFVQVGIDRVMGRLDDYNDPVCGCPLHTMFEGHVEGDRIEGVYVTHGDEFHMTTSGEWWVDRYERPAVMVTK